MKHHTIMTWYPPTSPRGCKSAKTKFLLTDRPGSHRQ